MGKSTKTDGFHGHKKDDIIRLEKVHRDYLMGNTKIHAVENINLDIHRGEFVAIVGPSGSGKCITGETEIILGDGTISKIQDLGYKDSPIVLSLDKENGKIRNFLVHKFYKRKVNRIIKIKTSSGKEINATEEHPFFTLTENGFSEIESRKLKENDFVSTARRINIAGQPQYLNTFNKLSSDKSLIVANSVNLIRGIFNDLHICRKEVCNSLNFNTGTYDSWLYKNNISLYNLNRILTACQKNICDYDKEIFLGGLTGNCSWQVVKVPLHTSNELLELYGFLAGDGNIDNSGVKITNFDLELRERVKFLAQKVFGVFTTEIPKRIDINKSVVRSFFINVFGYPLYNKSTRIKLPDFVFKCSDQEIASFIKGLFDCDSYVSKNKKEISITLASKELINQVRVLLLRFGIHSRYSEKLKCATNTKDKIKREYYCLSISGLDNLRLFKDNIGFNSENKLKILNEHLKNNKTNTNVDVIPCGKLLKSIRRNSKIKLKREVHDILWAYEKEKIHPSREKLKEITKLLKENKIQTKELDFLINADIFWDKIISVKTIDRETEVYDITVPNADNFIANEFIIHNSTMMNLVGALDFATTGDIYLDNVDIEHLHESDLAQLRGRKIGFIFQTFNLMPTLTALENVMLPMIFQGIEREERIERATKILNRLNMGPRLNHLPSELSGGEMQRVAIARALANDPEVILADEPTGNLDSKTGEEVVKIFEELNKEGKTIIMVTHDMNMAKHADKIYRLKDGMIVK